MKTRISFYLICTAFISAGLMAFLGIMVSGADYIPDDYKRSATVICAAVVFLAAFVFTRFLSRQAILPYEKFAATLERALIKGRFDLSAISGYNEFLPLAQSFNALMLRLNRQIDEASMHLGRIESLISSVDDGIFMVDHNMNIVLYNEQALKFLNISKLQGSKNILHLFRESEFIEFIRHASQSGDNASLDVNRGERHYRIHVSPAHDGGMVMLIIDITNIYKLERARSDFMENVTHELKTPLTTICGHSELIAEGMVTDVETIRKHMRAVNTEAVRMTGLIEDILRLSEIEHGIIGETERLNLRSVMDHAASSLSEMAASNEVAVDIHGDGTITAQYEHIYELSLNLLSNAIRYNKRKGSVSASIFETDTQAGLSVEDTGIGIKKEHIDRIFERFYRVDKARSRDTGGTGLGLSIVKHIATLYNGSVTVNSSENGTVFKVIFPK